MPRPHWILGNETHAGRGYFGMQCFELKRDALTEAREWGLSHKQARELAKRGRLELPVIHAKRWGYSAIELIPCYCQDESVHRD